MSLLDNYECEGQISMFDLYDLDTWCGKTSPEPSAPIKAKISGSSSKKQQKLLTKMPLFLDLRENRNGDQVGVFWETDGQSLGGYMMHSFGESPKEERESHLSQILEVEQPPTYSLKKYYLSPKACQGILNRAQRRGKKLPEILEQALIRQSVSKNEEENQGG